MRANIRKVIDAFRAGVAATGDRKNTCSTDGTIVYSYAMPIAKRINRRTVVIVPREDGPSATTRSQIDALDRALDPFCGHEECYGPGVPGTMGVEGHREACRKERIAKGIIPRIVRKSLGPVPDVPTGGSAFQR